jgi:ferredoxin--NADP+ reductase
VNETRKKKTLRPSKIVNREELAPNAFMLTFEKHHDFIPGQVVAIGQSAEDEEPRLYSIASGNTDINMDVLFDINPNGHLTPYLASLKRGDEIYVSEPFGRFYSDEGPGIWIATGTGIAPFIAMAKSGLSEQKTLLHGARFLNQFYQQTLFLLKMGTHYKRFCTRETAQGIIHGRLTDYLINHNSLPADIKYYLCGSPEMVIEVRELLVEQKGIPYENIVAEIYF